MKAAGASGRRLTADLFYRPATSPKGHAPMSTSNNTSVAERQAGDLAAKPDIDAAKLIHAKRSSPQRFKKLVEHYRGLGVADKDIIAAMVSSPLMVDYLGRGRRR